MLFNPAAIGINVAAFQFAQSLASPALTSFMLVLASSYIVLIPLIAIYMFLKKDRNVWAFMAAFIAATVITEVLKYVFQEPRPCTLSPSYLPAQVMCESGFAFPSEHAAMLTGLFAFLGKYKVLQAFYIVWVLFVLFGRVYLGQHYLTDVIAGAVLSLIIVYVSYHYRAVMYKLAKKCGLTSIAR